MFFKHFASKNQLPGLSTSGTLVENELNFVNTINSKLNLAWPETKYNRNENSRAHIQKNYDNWPGFILSYVYGCKFARQTRKYLIHYEVYTKEMIFDEMNVTFKIERPGHLLNVLRTFN